MSILSSKTGILSPGWIEIVFAGRNKSYGAYVLRKQNGSNTVRALLGTVLLFVAAVATPTIVNKIRGVIPPANPKVVMVETILPPPPPDPAKQPPPPPPEPPRPRVDQLRFPPMVVKPNNEVNEPDPPSIDDFKDADPGQKNLKGESTAPIRIDEPVGPSENTKVTEEEGGIFVTVENSAEYPGGLDKFYEYLSKSIHYPAVARENNLQGKVFLTFVVEKDGSLTDIKVLRGIGSGCDEEAVRVIKASKKWKPGIQNGREVRQQYTVPISFALAEN
jgi:protein TonB